MRAFLAGICFLLAFIATGNSLECVKCHRYSQKECTGELVTCSDAAKFCQTSIDDINYEGKEPLDQIFKSCSENANEYDYREQIIGVYYQLKIRTCQENGCNKEPIHYPSRNNTLNGVTCPTCYVEGAMSCESNNVTIQCTGDLTKCIYVAATLRTTDAPAFDCAYRGCTNLKDIKHFPHFPGKTVDYVHELQITNGI